MRLRSSQIDHEGFRANVAIVLCNDLGQLFWAKKSGMDAWQFPQGGIKPDESIEDAMFRELREETGLLPEHIEIIGCTNDWLRYRLPKRYVRRNSNPVCIGQKQIWYLLKLVAGDNNVQLDFSKRPEFDHWCWVEYWEPVKQVVAFKRQVYTQALSQLQPLLPPYPVARPGRNSFAS